MLYISIPHLRVSNRLVVGRNRQVGGVRVGGVDGAIAQQPVKVPCAVALQHRWTCVSACHFGS